MQLRLMLRLEGVIGNGNRRARIMLSRVRGWNEEIKVLTREVEVWPFMELTR